MEIFLLILQSVKSGLPFLISHFFTAIVIFVSGLWVYTKVTPMNELELIKGGNIAASLSFAGACVGIAIPLAVCLSSSVNIVDIIVWGSIAVILQLICFKVVDFFLKDLSLRIIDGEISISIVLVGFKLSIAVLNAAAVAG
jgi:putative membrane protein